MQCTSSENRNLKVLQEYMYEISKTIFKSSRATLNHIVYADIPRWCGFNLFSSSCGLWDQGGAKLGDQILHSMNVGGYRINLCQNIMLAL